MITVSVCLSDIPKSEIVEAKNGKKYVNLVLDERRETGQYGETHMLYMSQTKEERQNKAKKVFVGSGKEYKFEKRQEDIPDSDGGDGLPF
ncbi:hypothetical protein [Proteiniphilum sp. UBA5463]|jgi:hypothetical protein|uniref:hypothetical protein n=1 Tax=Proteiniphilum sp. UBA5463 TaxID=1947281 RepID=UPI00257A45DF|nr:hypothetical protein [Proteiniphilum sp. UBA5463]